MSRSKFSLLFSVGVTVALAMLVVSPVSAAPFLQVRIVDTAGNSTVVVNAVDDVVNFKIQARVADVGTVNDTTPRTITSLVAPSLDPIYGGDGFASIRLDVKQSLADQVQVSINSALSLLQGLHLGSGASGGTLTDRTNGYMNIIGAVGSLSPGVNYLGVPADNTTAWLDVMTGSFTVKALGTGADSLLMPGFWLTSEGGPTSAGSFRYNGGTALLLSQTASDPYVGFQGLVISTGVAPPAPAWGDGTAPADDSGTGALGPAQIAIVPLGTSYAGLTSTVVGVVNEPGGLGMVGTTAEILGGTNSSGADDESHAAWRTRLAVEDFLLSDVLSLTWMANASQFGQTDPFVLQMSYDPSLLPNPEDEEVLAAAGVIQLATPNGEGKWVNTILGNFGENEGLFFLGSWEDAGSPMTLGAWGVDTENNVAWAVVNHNSLFAVVPEPATMAFLALGGLAMAGMGLRRRIRKS